MARRNGRRNEELKRMVVETEMMNERVGRNVSRTFGHMKCVTDERMTKRVYRFEVEGR